MLVLAPAACIVGGIALSAAFDTLTRSVKYAPAAPPALLLPSEKVRLFVCKSLIKFFELFCAPGGRFLRTSVESSLPNVTKLSLNFFVIRSFSSSVSSMEVKIHL